MARKACGRKVDMRFSCLIYEYGCAEAGLDSDEGSTKALRERSIMLPKVLRDMFTRLVNLAPSQIHKIRTVGLLISGNVLPYFNPHV